MPALFCRYLPIIINRNLPWRVSMAGRGRSTFKKRQKELSRQEKQREKAARKAQRKLEKQGASPNDSINSPQDSSLDIETVLPPDPETPTS
jgi:hypothetical protein